MRRSKISIIALIMALFTVLSAFASCGEVENVTTEGTTGTEAADTTAVTTAAPDKVETTVAGDGESNGENDEADASSGADTDVIATEGVTASTEEIETLESTSLTASESESEKIEEETTEMVGPVLAGDQGAVIQNAQALANGIQTYYSADRSTYTVENKRSKLEYRLTAGSNPMVSAFKNTKGDSYFTDTMDVFVTTTAGKTYYASASAEQARVNLYRLGYYYYDAHFLEQDFVSSITEEGSKEIPIESFTGYKDVSKPAISGGEMSATIINQADPQFFASTNASADEYNYLQFSFKGNSVGAIVVYVIAGAQNHHTDKQSFTVEVTSDGSWHTYTVPLNGDTIPGYSGTIKGVRFDFGGAVNTPVAIKDVSFKNLKVDSIPLSLDRTVHSFPDKLHHEVHVVAYENTSGIDQIGVETKIPYNSVEKVLAKDAYGVWDDFKQVDWDSCEYVAFDVKDVGIVGFILPYDDETAALHVTVRAGNYLVTHYSSPEDGKILAPTNSTVNDFRMGMRLYNDETHDFTAFLEEAYIERNPLTEENIVIDAEKFARGAKFKGYDGIRGVYHITIKGANGFNDPYYNNQNLHYNASFSVKNDDRARELYFMTFTSSGTLECAVIMDEDNILLPIPLQVSKNFSEKEEPFYNCGDATYGETFFPITVSAGEEKYYTVLNIYQNWGNYPLKQLSSIGYYMPYYHLSTGVTETNCISPWYNRGKNLWTLPDHRPMSMPASSDLKNMYGSYGNQPQRPNAGYHYFLQYTDADGRYVTSEYVDNFISSYGPTYADLTMNYLSDDGKIKVSYRHIEMPQVDENRAYYEMTYEVLDTVVIDNFMEDFSFYTMTGFIKYEKVGYLNKKGEPTIRSLNTNVNKPFPLELSKDSPYFSLFYSPNVSVYANLSFLIYNSEFIIGGEKLEDYNFVVLDQFSALRLSLNLDEKVTLQKGDKFTINCIIMPWGGGYVKDDDVQYHPTDDVNVQNVRLNTLINPFKATPVADCEAVDSVFLPRVSSTNGKSATFTVTGGCDIYPESADSVNVTLRVDGFDTLARIKVEELVDGAWIPYELSSVNNPDSSGRGADYDGYQVHYDGDGTYGYSFVVTITDGVSRTFRVTTE